jgi:hypothetical protein
MDILFLVIISAIFAIASAATSENNVYLSRIFLSLLFLGIIYISLVLSLENKKEKFILATPISFQGKIACIAYENQLINCSDKFKIQFNTGDSIFIFQEQDDLKLGIKFSGGDFVYKTSKK